MSHADRTTLRILAVLGMCCALAWAWAEWYALERRAAYPPSGIAEPPDYPVVIVLER
jgi:hypothetical protein